MIRVRGNTVQIIPENKEPFSWSECFDSICSAALTPQNLIDFDSGHVAHQFNEYWYGLAAGKMPHNRQFSPVDIKACLKWLMVFKEVEVDGDKNFLLTLIGASASEMTVHAKKGQYLHEFTESECYGTRKAAMTNAVTSANPVFARIHMTPTGEYKTNVLVGMFPFVDDTGHRIYVVPCPENKKLRALM